MKYVIKFFLADLIFPPQAKIYLLNSPLILLFNSCLNFIKESCTTSKLPQNCIHVWWRILPVPRTAMMLRCTPSVTSKPHKYLHRTVAKVFPLWLNTFVWNTWKIAMYHSKNKKFYWYCVADLIYRIFKRWR